MKKFLKISGISIFSILAVALILVLSFYKADISADKNKERYFTAESTFIKIDGNDIHVRVIGEGDPVLLIHGSFSSLHTWEVWQEKMKKDFTTISVDLPGHGLTGSNPQERYDTDYNASVLWKLLDKLNYDTVAIAGNSMGGQVAYKMALRKPKQVTELILINSSGARHTADTADFKDQNSFSVFSLINHPVFSKLMTSITPEFLVKMSLEQVYYNQSKITEEKIQMYYDLILHEGNREATLRRFKQKTPSEFDDLKNITIPSLIMWGEHDSWIPLSHAHRFNKQLPNSVIKIYDKAGHVLMEEIPIKTAEDALEFLQK